MSDDGTFGRYGWSSQEKYRKGDTIRLARWGANGGSPHQSPRLSPHPSPRPPRNRRHSSSWRIPAFIKRKFERSGGRVGSTVGHDPQSRAAIAGQAFQDPSYSLKNPYLTSFTESSRDPFVVPTHFQSPYLEPEIYDVGGFREPRYLDLFEPGVQVIRDPKLDQPPPTLRERLQPLIKSTLGFLSSTRVIVGCSIALVVVVLITVTAVAVNRIYGLDGEDPRIDYPYVTTATSCGLVKGVIESEAFVFRGVPYALPPVERYRLRTPQLLNSLIRCWKGNYTANVTRTCWGYNAQGATVAGNEDCLLLDVFTPKLGYENPLPVVVYIGGRSLGSDDRRIRLLANAPTLSVTKKVIIVSPQIRRGGLGFLPSPVVASSVYPHTSGNQGASDFMAVLEWVNHNVEHFGGDNKRVTILAHQAGAAMVWPMVTQAHSRKLVQAVWLTGAAPVHPKLGWREANPLLSKSLNCSTIECIDGLSEREVMSSVPLDWKKAYGRPWLVADGISVPFEPSYPRVPIMFGSTEQSSAEHLLPWRSKISSQASLEEAVFLTLREREHFNLDSRLERSYPTALAKLFSRLNASDAINHYSRLSNNSWLLLSTLVSDATVTCPAFITAKSLAQNWAYSLPSSRKFVPPVYAYISQYQQASKMGVLSDALSDIEAILGVFSVRSESDRNFLKAMQDLFFTFVEIGSPERHGATPAHYGIYVVKEKIKNSKWRPSCVHWKNATRYARYF